MSIEKLLQNSTAKAVKELYHIDFPSEKIIVNYTRKEFEGDFTVVVFPFTRAARKAPHIIGTAIGQYLCDTIEAISGFNVIKGFVNLSFSDAYWLNTLQKIAESPNYGQHEATGKTVVLEYIGPNTNKPLHVGHLRNMFLGHAVSNILRAKGDKVHKVNIYNDRGIAICKSMLAWQKYANGATPASTGVKGDKFVGSYYVLYNDVYKKEVAALIAEGQSEEDAKKNAPIHKEVQEMLRKWEQGDADVRALWRLNNSWVYEGFNETYANLNISYEKAYCESDTYELGKKMVEQGLAEGAFYQKADGSVWANLEKYKLDNKVLLRGDGTSLYITQDLGVAALRYADYTMNQSIYVVGDEQNYHFKVLKASLDLLGKPYADGIFHLSYGMVDLPHGKMKSREGTVVDADDLITEMQAQAKARTFEISNRVQTLSPSELSQLFDTIGLGALKFYMLRIHPKNRILFNPQESIDLQGYTAVAIQYSYARIQSLKANYGQAVVQNYAINTLHAREKALVFHLYKYKAVIKEAAEKYDPAVIAEYIYNLSKLYNKLWADLPILKATEQGAKDFRVALSHLTGKTLRHAMHLMGIEVPNKM